jgi:hypothetical protein
MRPAVLLAVILVAPPARAQTLLMPSTTGKVGFAVDADAGGGRATGHGWGFYGGLGLGVYQVTDARYVGLTATASYVPWQPFAFGVAAAIAHVQTGLGFGAGGHVTTHGVWGVHGGPSVSVLHLEGQIQFDDATTKAIVLFLRIPVGLIVKMLSAPKK